MSIVEKLRNEALFREAFWQSPIGVAIMDADGRLVQSNPAASSLLGYRDRLPEGPFCRLVHPDDRAEADARYRATAGGKCDGDRFEARCVHRDGRAVWMQIDCSLVRDESGTPSFVVVQMQDISDRKSADMQLQLNKLWYQSLFDHHPDLIYAMDLEGYYTAVNRAFEKAIGYTAEQVAARGMHFRELTAPEMLERTARHFREAANGLPQRYESVAVDRYGNRIVFDVLNIPIVVEGKVVGVHGIAKDVSMEKELWDRLERSQRMYRIISDHSQDIISYCDPDGTLLFVSPAYENILGYEPGEVIGLPATFNWHPDDVAALRANGVLRHSDAETFVSRVRHKDGRDVWIETTATIIRGKDGGVESIMGVGRDISERKRAEEELRRTKERLESFVRNNADAIWVIDAEGIVLDTNEAFATLFQWKTQEIVGKPLPIVPPYLKPYIDSLHEKAMGGTSVSGLETVRLRKDGSTVEVSMTLSPLRDSAGAVVGLTGICRDISERKRAENELKAAIERMQSFISHNVDPIMIFDAGGKLVQVNESFERLFGWSSGEIAGLGPRDFAFVPDDREAESDQTAELLRTGKPISGFETYRMCKDGSSVSVSVTAFPLRDGEGRISGCCVTLRDTTERKQAEELLINSEKQSIAGQLAAGIAHEIRNPITAIKGFIQLMNSGFPGKREYFDIIASEIGRIELILNELLVLAKPQTVKYERRDVGKLLTQVIALLESQAIMKDVQLAADFECGDVFVWCDENQLKQVCINFIQNAIEAMPDGGEVVVRLARAGEGRIAVAVVDRGCGIPAHLLSKLGQPFYTTKEKGTGLGFMVSKRIIESHAGDLTVESREGAGTTVRFTLPIADEMP
ncbi:PAS domain S-box protein [Paenibacillus flagellatus]|uniref:histidine kinase n=1 Tax=Paenibacillus flagellatus TaxID=2211139 RepID=A0A2V5KMW5_9BACL|nr:PAS domain S-box protein [Paenibacillus flagellatus]PYI56600.1 hypothetical protein DLM86_06430 [Paenibacillus flagellatus]